MSRVLAIRFYDVVLSVHVMAVMVAFGAIFAYPVVVPWLRARNPGSMVVVHEVQRRVGGKLIAPVGGVALLAGAYLASDAHVWSEVWVGVPLVILLVILGVGGAVLTPMEKRAATLAAAGTDAPEYDAVYRRILRTYEALGAGVLVAIFFMVTKLGA